MGRSATISKTSTRRHRRATWRVRRPSRSTAPSTTALSWSTTTSMATRRAQAAFTIVELAVVMAIVGLLLAGAMMTLSAQAEQRAIDETRRRLNAAVEGLVAYAVVNGRLPCPAVVGVLKYGDEDPPAGGACTNGYGGFLPARTIGFQPTDELFYGLDAWNNRIRYAVSITAPTVCAGAPAAHFTTLGSMKTYGMSCKPGDLDVCTTAGACAAA